MKRHSLTTRLQPLLAILFAVGVLSAPAWHAAQAAQPADCCALGQVEDVPAHDQAGETCCCCPGETDAPAPQPTPEEQTPCNDDGHCPCCKNLIVVSPIAPVQTGVAILDLASGDTLAAPRLTQPDSRAVGIDIRPPIG